MIGAVVIVLLATGAAPAQNWDSPSFMGPRPGSDLGVYLVAGGGADLGFRGLWRRAAGPNLGIRLGFLDVGDGVIQAGAGTWGDIVLQGTDFPLDIVWTAGAGASVGGGTAIGVPVGISLGRNVSVSSVEMQIYGHPRLALVAATGAGDVVLDLDGQFDLGADVYLSDGMTLRVGVSLGGGDALGVGLAWRQ